MKSSSHYICLILGDAKTFVKTEDKKKKVEDTANEEEKEEELDEDNSILAIKRIGSILRSGEGRLQHLCTDKNGRVLAVHGTDNTLELFIVCTQEEIQKRLAKKAKKEKKRTGDDVNPESMKATVQEQFKRVKACRVSGKIKSVSVSVNKEQCRIMMVLANNQLEIVSCDVSVMGKEAESLAKIESLGHKSNVRTLAFSSDNTAILTASAEGVKVWNRFSLSCVRSMPCGNALSCIFAPGDRHALVGTKSGNWELDENENFLYLHFFG